MELPICKTCKHCANAIIIKAYNGKKGKIEIDCSKNPNLGSVSMTYSKCSSYEHV